MCTEKVLETITKVAGQGFFAIVLFFSCLIGQQSLGQDGWTELIAQTGDPSPDGNGVFDYLGNYPLLNNAGTVTFNGYLLGTTGGTTDDEGAFRHELGLRSQIIREGQLVPDASGTFGRFGLASQNNAGLVTIWATVNGSGVPDDEGIFQENGGLISQLARTGQSAPDANGTFYVFRDISRNQSGTVTFIGWLQGTSGGTFVDDSGIFTSSGGQITQIARAGQAAPDGNGVFGGINVAFDEPSLNNNGEVAFWGNLIGTSGGSSDSMGIFKGIGGQLTQIARAGEVAPDGNGVFQNFWADHVLNDTGSVAFSASLAGTSGGQADDYGLFLGSGGAITQIARGGQDAPGGTEKFDNLGVTDFTNSGMVAFGANLTGPVPGFGYFRYDRGATTQIVRNGQPIPDASATFAGINRFDMNESGAAAFWSALHDTSGGYVGDGIFLSDGQDLIQVARTGESIAGSAIIDLDYAWFGPNASGFNDVGQIAYRAITADGRFFIQKFTPNLHWRAPFSGSWDSASNWTLGLDPAEVHDVFIDTAASTTIYGPTGDSTVSALQIGGGTGIATLHLQAGAVLTSLGGVFIEQTGQLTGDGVITGNIINFGTVIADNLTVNSTLSNFNTIRGNGRMSANIVNFDTGQIRVDGGQSLHLTGPTTENFGLVRVIGGELIVDSPLQNHVGTGLITARDATLEFRGGVNNDGSLGISFGTTDMFGDITNNPGGIINVSGGANITFYDDLIQNGQMIVAAVGNTTSTAVLFGEFGGAGGFTGGGDVYAFGDLRIGNSPASVLMDGNLFLGASTVSLFELGGLEIGEFDQLVVTGDLSVDGELFVDLIDGHLLNFNQEYLIAEIDGELFGQFDGLDEGGLVGNFGGSDLFISYSAGSGNDIALFTAVPEPGFGMFGLATLVFGMFFGRRRR